MGRQPCCEKIGLKQGPWTADEDKKLRDFINTNGTTYSWRVVPKFAELLRCGKSCRLRWANYLRPNLKNDRLSTEEEERVIDLHSKVGNRSLFHVNTSYMENRENTSIFIYLHSTCGMQIDRWEMEKNSVKSDFKKTSPIDGKNQIKKILIQRGIDPLTHKPLPPALDSRDHKSRKRTGKSRGEIKDQEIVKTPLIEKSIIPGNNDLQLGKESLIIDADFSVEEIPVINDPQEILTIPQSPSSSVDDIQSNYHCSSSSDSARLTASTQQAINCTAHGWQHLHCHDINHVQRRNYIENPSCSYRNNVDDLDYWSDLLTRDFDIDKIDPKMFQPPIYIDHDPWSRIYC